MTIETLAAVLLSAVLHAAWNAMLKGSDDPAATASLFVAGAAALSGALAVAIGAELPRAAWGAVLASAAVEAVYFATLAAALARLPLGTAYGLARGGGQIVTWPASAWGFAEPVDARAIAGAALVAAGLVSTARASASAAGLGFAAACALAIGVYPLTYKAALAAGAHEAALFAASLGLALPLQVALLGRGQRVLRLRAAFGAAPRTVVVGAVLCMGSFLAFLWALEHAGAGRATALRNTSVLFAAAIGWARGEAMTPRSVGGAVAIAVGAVLVAW